MTRLLTTLVALSLAGLAPSQQLPAQAPVAGESPDRVGDQPAAGQPNPQDPAAAAPRPADDTRSGTVVRAPIVAVTQLHNTMTQSVQGIGLVHGLNGTGASDRATRMALTNFIRRHGLNVAQSDVTSGAVAMVAVRGEMEPFAAEGSRFAVKVSNLADALSLYGGNLLFAELSGVDGIVYATASGPVIASGVAAQGDNSKASRNHPTTGWVENGGQVVREMDSSFFSEAGDLELRVSNPSAFNANSIAEGCRGALEGWGYEVVAVNTSIVRIKIPAERRNAEEAIRVLNQVRPVHVPIEQPTRVIIDAAAGIVIAGGGVRISPCAVSIAELTITVVNDREVVQPMPGFNRGTTEIVDRSQVSIEEGGQPAQQLGGAGTTVEDLIKNLRDVPSLSPSQMVTVFRTLHSGGFLHAELVVR